MTGLIVLCHSLALFFVSFTTGFLVCKALEETKKEKQKCSNS